MSTCHEFDFGLGPRNVFKTNRVSNFGSESASNFLRNSFGNRDGGDLSGLRTPEPAPFKKTLFGEVLSHLSGFARPSISDHNQDLIL